MKLHACGTGKHGQHIRDDLADACRGGGGYGGGGNYGGYGQGGGGGGRRGGYGGGYDQVS